LDQLHRFGSLAVKRRLQTRPGSGVERKVECPARLEEKMNMTRIAAAALATFLLPLCTIACLDGDLTAVDESQVPSTDAGENLRAADSPTEPGENQQAPDSSTDSAGNDRPIAQITMPCDGLRIYEGRGYYFGGSASDVEDGELSYESFEWDLDGRPIPGCGEWDGWAEAGCGYGGWIESFELGPQVLTLTVTDSDGAQGSASITIYGVEFSNASFTDDILSFLLYSCENCHGVERAEGGIRLDSYEAIMTGGNENGPLIVKEDPTGGILIPQILSDHYYVDGYGLHVSQWMGETIIPVWVREGARNTDHPHPPLPEPRCGTSPSDGMP
jgi:hypothetical protein